MIHMKTDMALKSLNNYIKIHNSSIKIRKLIFKKINN